MCPTCYMWFGTDGDARLHMDEEHVNRVREHRCGSCTAAFELEKQLRAHTVDVHQQRPADESPVFECSECDRLYSNRGKLERHMVVHTNERPHACEKCEATFRLRDHLLKHMRSAHGIVEKRRH